METEFEDRLRQSLAARAADVRPDPETWDKVQRRIARGRTYRFAAGAALATAVIAAAAVVGPTLLSGPLRVDLQPAPADQPSEPAPTDGQTTGQVRQPLSTGDLGFVVTDGASIWVTDAAGRVLDAVQQGGTDGPIQDLAVRPDDEPGQITVVWRAGIDCNARLFAAAVTRAGTTKLPVERDQCPGAPVFSPDGTRLAWTEADPADPSAFSIRTAEWLGEFETEHPIAAGGETTFPLDTGEVFLLNIDDWVWTEGTGTETAGYLTLHANDATQRPFGFTLAIERQPDGQLALPPGAQPRYEDWLAYADSRWNPGAAVGPEYTVTAEEGGPALNRTADGDQIARVSLPEEYLASGGPRPWLSARGDVVAVGDGQGAAWWIAWTADGWSDWTRLPGEVRHAQVVALAAETGEPTEAAVEPLPEQEGLPNEVEEIRQAIAAAARTGNIDQLVMLTQITERFSIDFDEQDPRAYFTAMKERGELELLATILEFPYGTQTNEGEPTYYVWPYAHAIDDFNSLSSAQLQELEALAGPGEVAQWEELGEYWGPRLGIEERGAWAFFVRGGD